MERQTLLVASSEKGNVTAWDVQTGTALMAYKGNASRPGGCALVGREYMIASQTGKSLLHMWTWHKDQVHIKSFPPEQITALACSPDGGFCAGGGTSGAIHFWDVATGRLIRSWPAHYKTITSLAFSKNGTELVAGSEDTLVTAWILANVLDSQVAIIDSNPTHAFSGFTNDTFRSISPMHSWRGHTLPVTAVTVGIGGPNSIVISVSADRSMQIRSLGSGILLSKITLPQPLLSLAMDPLEHSVYIGSSHGEIYEVSLVGDVENTRETNKDTEEAGRGVYSGMIATEAGFSLRGDKESSSFSDVNRWFQMSGHTKAVTSLALTLDGSLLVSGSEDNSVRIWDLRTRQPIKIFENPSKGPVSSVLVIDRPTYMPIGTARHRETTSLGTLSDQRKGPTRPQPASQLSKYPIPAEQENTSGKSIRMLLDGINLASHSLPNMLNKSKIPDYMFLEDLEENGPYLDKESHSQIHNSSGKRRATMDADNTEDSITIDLRAQIETLKAENKSLKLKAEKAVKFAKKLSSLNAELVSSQDMKTM